MQKFQNQHFGEIEYDPEKVITFPTGLPGFPQCTKFLLMSEKESEDSFFWLQSLEEGEVVFTLMNVYKYLPDYNPQVEEEELAELGEVTQDGLDIYNIAVVPEYARAMRVNLLAPVVINSKQGLGKQVVCTNEDYPIRFMIFEELERAGKMQRVQ